MQPRAIREQYSTDEIRTWFLQADSDGNGSLSVNEFFRWSMANISSHFGDSALRVAFSHYDKDGTGSLDALEFAAACNDLGFGASAHQIFRELDDDRSGAISCACSHGRAARAPAPPAPPVP